MKGIRSIGIAIVVTMALMTAPATALGSASLFVTGGPDAALTFEAAEYPFSVTGERYENGPLKGATTLIETAKGIALSCEEVEFDGGELSEAATELTLDAAYSACFSESGKVSFSVAMNSCRYEYAELEYETAYDYDVTAEIACDEGDNIELSSGYCTVKIPPQVLTDDTEIVHTQFEGDDYVNVATRNVGVDYSAHGSPFACVLMGAPLGSYEDGASESDFILQGLFLAGGPPKVEAAEYPSNVGGQRFEDGSLKAPVTLLDVGKHEMTCEAVGVDAGELLAPTSTFTLGAAYSECKGSKEEGRAFSVSMNSCGYRYSGFEYRAESEFFVSAAIVCDEGDAIEISGSNCVVSIPPQSLGQDSIMANWKFKTGEESVGLAMEANTIMEYTASSFACLLYYGIPPGSHEDGSLQVGLQLEAT